MNRPARQEPPDRPDCPGAGYPHGDDSCLHRYEVNANERDAYPCVDDDALVQDTVENIDE